MLQELREMGVKICLDDFGTGYSSLSYLHRFPVDSLKIDGSFVQQIGIRSHRFELINTIINLAAGLDIEVVAEGVETSEQRNGLEALQCSLMQGADLSPGAGVL